MPATEYAFDYLKDNRGVNNTKPDELIPENCFSDSRNFMPARNGGNIIKRPGVVAQSNGSTYPSTLTSYTQRASINVMFSHT